MPILPTPDYRPPFFFKNRHIHTIYPTLFRPTPQTTPEPQRLELEDRDFLDIDRHFSLKGESRHLAIISHGLEGNARKKYMAGMARTLTSAGWDAICLNFRGCSSEINRLPRLYHSGVTDDLHRVICHALSLGKYSHIGLIGFSMGGNQTLKYLGEAPEKVPSEVKCSVTISVPTQLDDSGVVMEKWDNRIYMLYFMHGLHRKVRIKAEMFPDIYTTDNLRGMHTFTPFDNQYTAPVHGYTNAQEYYTKCSSKQFLKNINIPSLLVQAADDPFLSESCYPKAEARKNNKLFLEIPRYGGHVGFVNDHRRKKYWAEERALQFLQEIV